MKNRCVKRGGAWAALGAMLALAAACTSIEPMTAPNDDPELWGDKTWAYVHPWYDRDWSGLTKSAYWIGPGH